MSKIIKRPAPKKDLIDLFIWYAENASLDVADRFLATTDKVITHLCRSPESGIPVFVTRSELLGMRRFPVNSFDRILIFYFPLPDGIDLVRIVHGSRDLQKLFDEGFFN